jgi:hypothetical protein
MTLASRSAGHLVPTRSSGVTPKFSSTCMRPRTVHVIPFAPSSTMAANTTAPTPSGPRPSVSGASRGVSPRPYSGASAWPHLSGGCCVVAYTRNDAAS